MSLPATMRAARLVAYNKEYQMTDIDVPKLGDGDLLFKVGAAGFCHTDYQVYEGVYQSKTPMTPSHEPVGTVVAVGKNVTGNWKVGDRIGALLFRHPCGQCDSCKRHIASSGKIDHRFCEKIEMAGIKDDGGFAEYMIADSSNSVHLPDSISFEQAAPLMCAGTTVWGGMDAAQLKPGDPVGVIGIGGLGQLAIQFLKALGHPTVAIDRRPEALALANEVPLKADLVIDSNSPTAVDDIKRFANNDGLAAVLVCTDDVPINTWSVKLLRLHGCCVVLGLPTAPLEFSAFDLVFKEITVVGSLVSTRERAEVMMELIDKHKIRSHVTCITLEEAPKLLELYMNPHLKGRLVVKM